MVYCFFKSTRLCHMPVIFCRWWTVTPNSCVRTAPPYSHRPNTWSASRKLRSTFSSRSRRRPAHDVLRIDFWCNAQILKEIIIIIIEPATEIAALKKNWFCCEHLNILYDVYVTFWMWIRWIHMCHYYNVSILFRCPGQIKKCFKIQLCMIVTYVLKWCGLY